MMKIEAFSGGGVKKIDKNKGIILFYLKKGRKIMEFKRWTNMVFGIFYCLFRNILI